MPLSYLTLHGVPKILFPLTVAAGLLLATGCTTPAQTNDFNGLKVSYGDNKRPPEFGKGQEGRIVNGTRIYTVMMMLSISKAGNVTDVEMIRTDAPPRLQWAAMQAIRKHHYGPQPEARDALQVISFKGFDVKPG